MNKIMRRNRLTPWYIGIAIVLVAVFYVGYQMYATRCAIPPPLVFIVLVIIPVVYLGLMYLTLTRADSIYSGSYPAAVK